MLIAVLAGAGAAVLATSACGGTNETEEVEFRIYDPTGKVDTQITTADIDRGSAGVLPLENLRASVYVDFTVPQQDLGRVIDLLAGIAWATLSFYVSEALWRRLSVRADRRQAAGLRPFGRPAPARR